MKLLTLELLPNASAKIFYDNILNFFKKLPKHLNLEGQQQVLSSVISYPSIDKNVDEEEVKFVGANFSNSFDSKYQTPSLNPSTTDVAKAMKTFIQEKNYHNETCLTVKLFKATQRVEICIVEKRSDTPFVRVDWGHTFGSTLGIEYAVLFRANGLHYPDFVATFSAYNLSWYTQTWLSNIMLAPKKSLSCCVAFHFEIRNWGLLTTG